MTALSETYPFSSVAGIHVPVMLREVLDFMAACDPKRILDCCFGGGGHSRALLERTSAHVVAVDCDPQAKERAREFEAMYGDRFEFHSMNYSGIDRLSGGGFDGILYDLGISSFHVDEGERGFSFRQDAPVDMRMDPTTGQSAAEFLEGAPYDDLVAAVREYGEEQNWKRVVQALMSARGTGRLSRTVSLAQVIEDAIPGRVKRQNRGIHPATKTFQGIRMWVNQELEHLGISLPKAFSMLNEGGRLMVISFHSLEDRIVKRMFREWAGQPVDANDSRSVQDRVVQARLITRKPCVPAADEIQANSRSRSARLRVLERLPREQKGAA